jgi:hypothetical protein
MMIVVFVKEYSVFSFCVCSRYIIVFFLLCVCEKNDAGFFEIIPYSISGIIYTVTFNILEMFSRLTGRMPFHCRRCSTASRDSIIENMQTNVKAYGLMLSLLVASISGVNFLVSSHIYPISQEQKLQRQDMTELRQDVKIVCQDVNNVRQEMHHEMKGMRQEMTQNQKELLLAVSKIDDKYAMHGERLAKLEK